VQDNFGCGSSREHAPWAILEYGIRSVIAPSFAEIFFNNSFNNGLLPIVLEKKIIDSLHRDVAEKEGYELAIDLAAQRVTTPEGQRYDFDIDAFRKHCLLNGLDDIGLTLEDAELIQRYETQRRQTAPWLFEQHG